MQGTALPIGVSHIQVLQTLHYEDCVVYMIKDCWNQEPLLNVCISANGQHLTFTC